MIPIRSIFFASLACWTSTPAWAQWATLTGRTDRVSVSDLPFPSLASPAWVCSQDGDGNTIRFIPASSPAVFEDTVYAIGRVRPVGSPSSQYALFAIRRTNGTVRWQSPLSRDAFVMPISSYSSPTIDPIHRIVIVPSGNTLAAYAIDDGQMCWQSVLEHLIVNATAAVTSGAPNGDLSPANRAFITDFDGASGDGRLYCINIDCYDATKNPFQPGDIVWSDRLPGTVGNTPAYALGKVFVASTGVQSGDFLISSEVRAYDATSSDPDVTPVWTWISGLEAPGPIPEGFFGGVSVHGPTVACDTWSVYAATYNFSSAGSSLFQSHLVKLDANDGHLLWQTPTLCNRTSSIPIPLDDGRIVLSGGIAGFGTLPTVEVFQDSCNAASRLWDSVSATWVDRNSNGILDLGEFLVVGGRTQQPIVSTRGGSPALLVPTPPFNTGQDDTGYATAIQILNLDASPMSASFVRQSFWGAGSSPALTDRNIYTIGASGLYAFGPAPADLDVDDNKCVNVEDLLAWEQGIGLLDVDRNGIVDDDDHRSLREGLRLREPSDMTEGR